MSNAAALEAPADAISIKELASLLKPRVMTLVVFSGAVGMWLAPGVEAIHPFIQVLIIACIALGSGAGGMINMWYDRDIDAVMKRTAKRPIPSGKIAADDVLTGGVMLSIVAVMLLGLATNWVAAGWLAFAIFFYAIVYTMWLKRATPQNIVIGGAAGAFPPVIGWAAVSGGTPIEAWALFAIIFFWTPPHFWALALFCNEDYSRAKVPMLPVTHGIEHTTKQMMVYSLVLAAITYLPVLLGFSALIALVSITLLNVGFLWLALKVYQQPHAPKPAKRLFGFSILYLFAIFTCLWVDRLILA